MEQLITWVGLFRAALFPDKGQSIVRDFPDKMLPKIGISLLDAVFYYGENGGQSESSI